MTSSPFARIVLEVDPGTEPIVGLMSREGAAPRSFSGWMGLFSALEQEMQALTSSVPADAAARGSQNNKLGTGVAAGEQPEP
jgi:hypothetical protein